MNPNGSYNDIAVFNTSRFVGTFPPLMIFSLTLWNSSRNVKRSFSAFHPMPRTRSCWSMSVTLFGDFSSSGIRSNNSLEFDTNLVKWNPPFLCTLMTLRIVLSASSTSLAPPPSSHPRNSFLELRRPPQETRSRRFARSYLPQGLLRLLHRSPVFHWTLFFLVYQSDSKILDPKVVFYLMMAKNWRNLIVVELLMMLNHSR